MDEEEKPAEKDSKTISDEVNEEELAPEPKDTKDDSEPSRINRWKEWYLEEKKWTIPASVVLLVLLLAAIPFSRYHAAGLVLKKDYQIQVTDSVANTPVSGATVTLGSISAVTNGSGKATLHQVKVGNYALVITKKYYQDKKVSVVVPILKEKVVPNVPFTATGRQVKLSVTNLISKKALGGVNIKVADIIAKTDQDGTATIVVPAKTTTESATLSLEGYNDATVTIQASDKEIKENDFNLTPAGKVYFLSKLSGKIDVAKANLDGSNRQTVLAGTGREDSNATVLLASRDWKYLALLSKRDNNPAALYLISTADDSLTTIDQGDADLKLVGWSDDNFIYQVNRNHPTDTQASHVIKSYNAPSKQLILLDQTTAKANVGADPALSERYGTVYLADKNVVYDKGWDVYYNDASTEINSKQASVNSIGVTGKNHQTIKTFGYESGKSTFISSIPDKPGTIYYQVNEKDITTYYQYDNGKLTSKNDLTDDFNDYYQNQITYLQSPDGNNTFWADQRDGKQTLFIGDAGGNSGKQIGTLSDYKTYGWYSDDYLLASKNSSELYILPVGGIKEDSDAIKITDYHKPAVNYYGYGGGYGGI
jgi:hypothetical protein